MPAPFTRYLVCFGASGLAVFLAAWAYIAFAPMAFSESGYASWKAKQAMLDGCQLGQLAFFGDSRLEAGVIPALLATPSINFGLPAGTPIETHSAVRRAVACANPPAQAVIALTPSHLAAVSRFFWLLSVRYGFISFEELRETERWADRLGDAETLATPTADGLTGKLRDVLYAIHFPTLSFSSLVQGQVFRRYSGNVARFGEVIRDRGWSEYSGAGGARVVPEMTVPFAPPKLQKAEFEAAVGLLRQRGVEVLLLVLPFAEGNVPDPSSQQAYVAYLRELAQRPGVHVVTDELPVWPEGLFVDGEHLNGAGARAFTAKLAQCMSSGRLQPGCDLRWTAATAGQLPSPVLQVQQ
jgi:hypothetical protein